MRLLDLKASFCILLILILQKLPDAQAAYENQNVSYKRDELKTLNQNSDNQFVKDAVEQAPTYFVNKLDKEDDDLTSEVKALRIIVEKKLVNGPDKTMLLTKINHLEKQLKQIKDIYNWYRYLKNHVRLSEEEVSQFVNHTFENNENQIKIIINRITELLEILVTDKNIVFLLSNSTVAHELMCERHQSGQQTIYFLFRQILMADVRCYEILEFLEHILLDNKEQYSELYTKDQLTPSPHINLTELPEAIKNAVREVWQCGSNLTEGENYVKLHPIFQKIIVWDFEADPEGADKNGKINVKKCEPSCPSINGHRQYFNGWSQSGHACKGQLRDCETQYGNLTVCKSKDADHRRYDWLYRDNNRENDWVQHDPDIYGHLGSCEGRQQSGKSDYYIRTDGFGGNSVFCEACLCTCDNSQTKKGVHFDFTPLTSDIHNNKVITGIHLGVKDSSVLGQLVHLEIFEGELLPYAIVAGSKQVPYPKDDLKEGNHAPVQWENRTICLDVLDYRQTDRVLTGVKFGTDDNGEIQVNIRMTGFDSITGKLNPDDSLWFNQQNLNGAAKRSKLDIANLKLPNNEGPNEERSLPGQCIRLELSGMKDDVGQSVVPFIDTQILVTDPHIPLSGFGLYLRGAKDTSGFLAPKLITYNYRDQLP